MTAPKWRRTLVLVLMVALGAAALRDASRLGGGLPWRNMDDFPDFYCAGWALDGGESPYTYEPLHACEHRVNAGETYRGQLFARNPGVAVPAPQPPFDFLPFMALARLPFGVARAVDGVAILLAVAICVVALAALGVPWELGAAAFLLSTAYTELNTGQIVPFSLMALVLGGLAFARRRDAAGGLLVAMSVIEPTAGLPAVAAALLFVPRARVAAIATLVLLATSSIAVVGPAGFVGYVMRVLPAHGASELHFPFQYSVTYVAAYFGAAPATAQLAGGISYLIVAGIGLALARPTSAALERRELILFVPALCAVIGGAFLHQEELCFALPALLVFVTAMRGRSQAAAAVALCVLAIPWIAVWGAKQLFLASLFVGAAILLIARIDWRVAAGTLCAVAALLYALELRPPHLPVPSLPASYAPGALVQTEWRDYTEGRSTRDSLWFLVKLPTWAALLAALVVAARYARRSPPASESSRGSSRESPYLPTASRRVRMDSGADRF